MTIAKLPLLLAGLFWLSEFNSGSLYAQEKSNAFITGDQPSDTCREILLPLWKERVARRLKVEAETVSKFKSVYESEPVVLPPFTMLEKDEKSAAAFFESLRRRQRSVDGKFEVIFGELTKEQQDGLLGYYVLKNGAESLLHASVRKRLSISDGQQQKLSKALADAAQVNRELWRENKFVEVATDSELPTLLRISSLRNIARFLSEKQQFELQRLFAASPPTPAYFTLGL
ncbi:MAG TPA: hypothetical protein DDW52_30345 [Planctomycetaceae bacterium]|nr:hypothetical protein [Planctomycetaceae bacterium]